MNLLLRLAAVALCVLLGACGGKKGVVEVGVIQSSSFGTFLSSDAQTKSVLSASSTSFTSTSVASMAISSQMTMSSTRSSSSGLIEALPDPQPLDIKTNDRVTLTQGTYSFLHYDYTLNSDFSIANNDYTKKTSSVYDTWIIENDYLKITLVPSFGGRILSMFNKKTGHEELYQNPIGSPYLIGKQIFYYDWLMIMGGIFPTFPEPEHGKSWLRSWDLKVIAARSDIVTLAMSYQDKDEYPNHPDRMSAGRTDITCTYWVTLKAGRSAIDVTVTLENASSSNKSYEYWTDTTLAPGSQSNAPKATDGLEMIAPITQTDFIYGIGVNQWKDIRWFKNHTGEGIAYAKPNMQDGNFWGAINHDNEEGIFRISDNKRTPGLKIWTFGRDNTLNLNPLLNSDWHRPAIELWAGTGNQFFSKSIMPANSRYNIDEVYSPSVGLTNVTHATKDVLANITRTAMQFYFLIPAQDYRLRVSRSGVEILNQVLTPDVVKGNLINGDFSGAININLLDAMNRSVMQVNL
jgi:hypothetical protein